VKGAAAAAGVFVIYLKTQMMSIKIFIKRNTQWFRRKEIHFLFLMIFILGLYGLVKYENMVGRPSSSQLMISHNMSTGIEHEKVNIICSSQHFHRIQFWG
jgi:hypothetical protein